MGFLVSLATLFHTLVHEK